MFVSTVLQQKRNTGEPATIAGEGALASLEVDLERDEGLPRPVLSSGRNEDILRSG